MLTLAPPAPASFAEDSLACLLAGPTTTGRQRAVLAALALRLDELRRAHKLPAYQVEPGLRLRRVWGKCHVFNDGRPPLIQVRCVTAAHDAPGGAEAQWCSADALTLTLLHEMAHLRHRGHGAPFWSFLRRLVDEAAARGLYDPTTPDAREQARGDEKLAGSAASERARAARSLRRARLAASRQAAAAVCIGDTVWLDPPRGRLAGVPLLVVEKGPRGGLVVRTPDRRHYRVPARLLRAREVV